MKRYFLYITMFAYGLFAVITVAYAQDTVIRADEVLSPWMEMLMSAVSILIGGAVLYISTWVKAKFGIDIETRHRQALQTAVENGAGLVLATMLSGAKNVQLDVRSPLIADAVRYVLTATPDAVKNFELGPDAIAEKIIAKIGIAAAGTATKEEPS